MARPHFSVVMHEFQHFIIINILRERQYLRLTSYLEKASVVHGLSSQIVESISECNDNISQSLASPERKQPSLT